MKKYILLSVSLIFGSINSNATTLISNVGQVPGTLNLSVSWGETDVNLSDPSTSLHKFKLNYKLVGGATSTIDNITGTSRSLTISGLAVGTYEVELIEVIRVQVPPTPFSLPYVDTESSSGVSTTSIMSLNAAPVANCSNRTLSVGNDTQVNLWGYQAGEGSTDPNGDPLTFSLNPEGPYGVGNHTIELTVSDPEGLNSKCTFTLTVVDDTPPVVLAKNAVIFIKENGYAELNIEDIDNRSYDNVSWVHKAISKRLFTCEDVGFNSVTLTVSDESGNSSSKQVTVQVVDNTEPYIIDKPITLYANELGKAVLTQAILDTLVYDNCGLKMVTVSKDTFSLENSSDSLTIIATDLSGNVSAKKIWVTVIETSTQQNLVLENETPVKASNQDTLQAFIENENSFIGIGRDKNIEGELLSQNQPLFFYGPNPVEDKLKVGILREGLEVFTLKILDENGKLVQTQKIPSKEINLDLSRLNRGTYFIHVSSKNESESKRIELRR
ncbi:Por secretion system C-terminal sorting domain-containing protein [Spirosomataceae bacterium TFI 002]|nr:Por secretion system C-terminal sorting domain-containing protein [Spirosomataceae bacterium TFI 002]